MVWTHKDTPVNEVMALRLRHQLDTGATYTAGDEIYQHLIALKKSNGGDTIEPWTQQQVIRAYGGAQAKKYQRGRDSLKTQTLTKLDGRVRMFLKDDKFETNLDETGKFSPPRCIQYRNERYSLSLAQYIKAIEVEMCKYVDDGGRNVFAKGRNLSERAEDLRAKWDDFVDPVAVCLDHSKFDCHVKVNHLKQEHRFYKSFNKDRKLNWLLKQQLVNKGCTKNGLTYVTKGTRMSGDQNTSCGNSAINYGMLAEAFKLCDARFYIDGDDSVVVIDSSQLRQVNFSAFEMFGMITKAEIVREFSKVEFCQCRPVNDGVQWHMTRNPWRALARLPWIVKKAALYYADRHIKSVGMCEVACNYGMPILQAIGWKMIELGKGKYIRTDRHYQASLQKIKPEKIKRVPVRYETRLSYEDAWDINVEQQLRIESFMLQKGSGDLEWLLETILPSDMTL